MVYVSTTGRRHSKTQNRWRHSMGDEAGDLRRGRRNFEKRRQHQKKNNRTVSDSQDFVWEICEYQAVHAWGSEWEGLVWTYGVGRVIIAWGLKVSPVLFVVHGQSITTKNKATAASTERKTMHPTTL
jgi:hypothetical protein